MLKVLLLTLLPQLAFAERYIVLNPSKSQESQLNSQGKVVRKMKYSSHLVVNLSSSEAKKVGAIPDAVLVSSNRKNGGGSTNPAPQVVPWGVSRIGAVNTVYKGTGVRVCVVDTGVSKSHPDLRVVGGENFVVQKGRVDPSAWDDDNGHGSHVAGTIAALDNSQGVVGVAPQASLLAVKVLDSRGSGYLSDIADGVLSCVRMGSHVINMSLGGNGDPNLNSPLKQAINTAVAAGVHVVVAAGNEAQNIAGKVPAGYSNVVAVAASDSSDRIASFSNFGLSSKDVTAPGVAIASTWKGTGYNTISGTSMAAPHVAGLYALMVQSGVSPALMSLGYSVFYQGAGLLMSSY